MAKRRSKHLVRSKSAAVDAEWCTEHFGIYTRHYLKGSDDKIYAEIKCNSTGHARWSIVVFCEHVDIKSKPYDPACSSLVTATVLTERLVADMLNVNITNEPNSNKIPFLKKER